MRIMIAESLASSTRDVFRISTAHYTPPGDKGGVLESLPVTYLAKQGVPIGTFLGD